MNQILKVLVGSRAHGLHLPDSDYDYRGVFQEPTLDILSLNHKQKSVEWIEGEIDNTSWELGHFLSLALKCNPTILEVFGSYIEETTEEGKELIDLFPSVWNSKGVHDAFSGYSYNQLKKFIDNKDNRKHKYAVAMIRTYLQGVVLFNTGDIVLDVNKLTSKIHDRYPNLYLGPVRSYDIMEALKRIKQKDHTFSDGEILNFANGCKSLFESAYTSNPMHESDPIRINRYLIKQRLNDLSR